MSTALSIRRLTAISAALLFPLVACAQIQLGGFGSANAARKQHVELLTDSLQLTANKTQDVEIRFRVDPGYHINSHRPKDEVLIPTELKLDPGALHIADEQYPAGSRFHLAIGSGEDLDVYQGEFRVTFHMEASSGQSILRGSLRYQACDTASCYPAKSLPIQIAITSK